MFFFPPGKLFTAKLFGFTYESFFLSPDMYFPLIFTHKK